MGLGGFEPPTSPLSGVRSNQLSYRPGVAVTPVWLIRATDTRLISALLLKIRIICAGTHAVDCDAFSIKEVIQPQVPLGLPCYDFTPVMNHKVVSALPKVKLPTSFATHSHGVTGGVYKARERIHRDVLIRDY